MYPVKNDYSSKAPVAALSADWLNTVANMLSGLKVTPTAGISQAEVIPPNQEGRGWEIKIPVTSGSGLPSNAGKSKWMVPTLSADNLGTELVPAVDNPALWTVDWFRMHA